MKYSFGRVKNFMHVNGPTILTVLSVSLVVVLPVVSGHDTTKAETLLKEKEKDHEMDTKEKLLAAAPCYIPTALVEAAALASILCNHAVNRKLQASLITSYALLEKVFHGYRKEIVNRHGEAEDKEIMEGTIREQCDYHYTDSDVASKKMTFFEPYTGQSFERYERDVIDAEYHFNRNYVMRGCASLNELCEMLGIKGTKDGEVNGWNIDSELYWVDFEHVAKIDKLGNKYYEIVPVFEPTENYLDQ